MFNNISKPLIMGILNVTPDSFSDGGLYLRVNEAVTQASQMLAAGADILDIGGESTRPGSDAVSAALQIERVVPVIEFRSISSYPFRIQHDSLREAMYRIPAATLSLYSNSSGVR